MKLSTEEYEILPYEKCLRYGPEALTDTELIAIILRCGTVKHNCLEIAGKLMAVSGGQGLLGLKHLTLSQLKSIEGIGNVKAVMLKCIGEISSRISITGKRHLRSFSDSGLVADYYMEKLRHLEKERFMLMLLDVKCRLIHESVISVGTVNFTCVSAREIFRDAVSYGAVYLIMIHNHPSGDPTPSNEDIDTTTRIFNAGMLMGIPLIDHIIIGDNCYVSFKEKKLLGKE